MGISKEHLSILLVFKKRQIKQEDLLVKEGNATLLDVQNLVLLIVMLLGVQIRQWVVNVMLMDVLNHPPCHKHLQAVRPLL